MGKTEHYIVGLLERLLGPAERGKRFEWARGDISSRTGRAMPLPFDAVWEVRKLIVEVDEDHHSKATPFFDKPDRLTVSGVSRREQRRIYDARKRDAARTAGYRLVPIEWSRRRRRSDDELAEVQMVLLAGGVTFETDL